MGFHKKIFRAISFDLAGFKEITWFQNNLIHFTTQDFRYYLTPKSAWNYLLWTSGISFILSIVLLIVVLMKPFESDGYWGVDPGIISDVLDRRRVASYFLFQILQACQG